MFKKFCALLLGIFIFSSSATGENQLDEVSNSLFRIQLEQAKKGNAHDQFAVGQMFEKGLGTPRDLTKAHSWYQKSADQGFREARRKLENWAETKAAEERAGNLARQNEQRRLQQETVRKKKKKVAKKKVLKKATPVVPALDKKQAQAKETAMADSDVVEKSVKEAGDKDREKPKGFSVNPCEGPTAKFLTTCRR
jgi:Sel1 repeat